MTRRRDANSDIYEILSGKEPSAINANVLANVLLATMGLTISEVHALCTSNARFKNICQSTNVWDKLYRAKFRPSVFGMQRWNAAKVYMPDPYLQILVEVINFDVDGHTGVTFKKRPATGEEIVLILYNNRILAPLDTFRRLQTMGRLIQFTPGEQREAAGSIRREEIRQIAYFLIQEDGWIFVPNRETSMLYYGTPGIESKCIACSVTTETLAKCSCHCERVYCSSSCQATDQHFSHL